MEYPTLVLTSIEACATILESVRERLSEGVPEKLSGVVGFDGFVDTFIRMRNPASMAEFGPKVAAAAGIAASYPVHHQGDKFGGNGPLFATALKGLLGASGTVTYVGGIGYPEVEPIFEEALAGTLDRLVPLAPSAHSDCLEFTDGKIMLGDFDACGDVTLERMLEVMGEAGVDDLLRDAAFVSAVNWGKLPHVGEIWSYVAERLRVLGRTPKSVPFFMDLAEFEHRETADVDGMVDRLGPITEQCTTLLSFNLKEAWQLGERFGGGYSGRKDPESVAELAAFLRKRLEVDRIIIHPNDGAACATGDLTVYVPGPYCKDPLISTGAGDHFGAGCLAASLCGLDGAEMVMMGNATSGYFVRSGRTPGFADLIGFLESWSNGILEERL